MNIAYVWYQFSISLPASNLQKAPARWQGLFAERSKYLCCRENGIEGGFMVLP